MRVPDLDTALMDQKYAQYMSELIHNPTTKFKEGQEADGSKFIIIEDHSKAMAYPQEDVLLTAPNSQAQAFFSKSVSGAVIFAYEGMNRW